MPRQPSLRGFTLIELTVIVGVVVLAAVMLISLSSAGIRRGSSRSLQQHIKSSTHVRAIQQGLWTWAQNDEGHFPLPSRADVGDHTVRDFGEAKNTTANMFSLLVFNKVLAPDVLVSPIERGNVHLVKNYTYVRPPAAINSDLAVFDPTFSADFTSSTGGNVSYAHLQPTAGRLAEWTTTNNPLAAIVGDRGPEVTSLTPSVTLANPKSVTLTNGTWSGSVAYNDGHVMLERGLNSSQDCIFFDELANPANSYLGIFTKAGKEPADFTAIWD